LDELASKGCWQEKGCRQGYLKEGRVVSALGKKARQGESGG